MDVQTKEKALPEILQVMTTEYYNLQSARSIAVSEAMGRSSLYLSTVSTSLVALAFVGQIAHLGTAFFLFAFVVFPALFFLGLVTFQRAAQISLDDFVYARGMSRIRHLFVEIAPSMREYFILTVSDDTNSTYADPVATTATQAVWWQIFLTTPGMIGVINSLIAGVFCGLLVAFFFGVALEITVAVGIIGGLVLLLTFYRYLWTRWQRAQQSLVSRFPSDLPSPQHTNSQ